MDLDLDQPNRPHFLGTTATVASSGLTAVTPVAKITETIVRASPLPIEVFTVIFPSSLPTYTLRGTDPYRADLIVEDILIIELKSVEALSSLHKARLFNYLRLAGLQLGLLINFNTIQLKTGIQRVINTVQARSPFPPFTP